MNHDIEAIRRLIARYERPNFLAWVMLIVAIVFLVKMMLGDANVEQAVLGLLCLLSFNESDRARKVLLPMLRQSLRLSEQEPDPVPGK